MNSTNRKTSPHYTVSPKQKITHDSSKCSCYNAIGRNPMERSTSIMANFSFELPILKTPEQMAKISGIGENKIRELMDSNALEFVRIGNRRLLTVTAILDWYERNKAKVVEQCQ